MFKKKVFLYLLVCILVLFFAGAISIGYTGYKGYRCYSQGKIVDYILEKWKERLDLTDGQVEEIKALIENTKEERQKIRDSLCSERKAIAEIFFREDSTKDELMNELNKVKDNISRLMESFSGLAIDIKNVLTPEQLNKLKEYYEQKGYCRFAN
ncbi:MAG: hypothetical protein D6734_08280 [Candidatus Schekmanbacteria bacterium]|nr:MAG: hypothetical protein D6734_08280 [Candidatus Schekmanbacteria bacterium]